FLGHPVRPPRSSLSLHDALPIYLRAVQPANGGPGGFRTGPVGAIIAVVGEIISCARILNLRFTVQNSLALLLSLLQNFLCHGGGARKSTRLNSSHVSSSYAVFSV